MSLSFHRVDFLTEIFFLFIRDFLSLSAVSGVVGVKETFRHSWVDRREIAVLVGGLSFVLTPLLLCLEITMSTPFAAQGRAA